MSENRLPPWIAWLIIGVFAYAVLCDAGLFYLRIQPIWARGWSEIRDPGDWPKLAPGCSWEWTPKGWRQIHTGDGFETYGLTHDFGNTR